MFTNTDARPQVPIPTDLAEARRALPSDTPEPAIFACDECGNANTATDVTQQFISAVLGSENPDVPQNHVFEQTESDAAGCEDAPGPTDIAGVHPAAWGFNLRVEDIARLAVRSREFQRHFHFHTKSCFKGKGGTCRYGFPHDAEPARVEIVWTPDGATKNIADRTAADVQTLRFVPERDASTPYTNKHSVAMLAAFPCNTDWSLVCSCPGLSHYVCGYISKSASDCPAKQGINTLTGFTRAIASIAARRARDAAAATTGTGSTAADEAHTTDAELERLRTARHILGASLSDGTKGIVTMANAASHHLLFGPRFRMSHNFATLNLTDALAWVRGGLVSARMVRVTDGDEEHFTGVCDAEDYAFRGSALASVNYYETLAHYRRDTLPKKMPSSDDAPLRCPITGEALHLHLPLAVPFKPGHPLAHTHCLRRRAAAVVPQVFTSRLPCPEALAAHDATDDDVVSNMLRYLVLLKPWTASGAGLSSLPCEPEDVADAYRRFVSVDPPDDPDEWRDAYAARIMAHDTNDHDTRRVTRRTEGSSRSWQMSSHERALFREGGTMYDPSCFGADDVDALWVDDGVTTTRTLDPVAASFLRTQATDGARLPEATTTPPHSGGVFYTCDTPRCLRCGEVAVPSPGDAGTFVCAVLDCPRRGMSAPDLPAERDLDAGSARFTTLADDPPDQAGAGRGGAMSSPVPSIDVLIADLAASCEWPGDSGSLPDEESFLRLASMNPDGVSDPANRRPLNALQHSALVVLAAALMRGYALDNQGLAGSDRLLKLAEDFGEPGSAIRFALLGAGGTGKSFVLSAFYQYASMVGLTDRVVLTATTGNAAAIISASTWHSTLHVPVMKKKDTRDDSYEDGDDADAKESPCINTADPVLAAAYVLICDEASESIVACNVCAARSGLFHKMTVTRFVLTAHAHHSLATRACYRHAIGPYARVRRHQRAVAARQRPQRARGLFCKLVHRVHRRFLPAGKCLVLARMSALLSRESSIVLRVACYCMTLHSRSLLAAPGTRVGSPRLCLGKLQGCRLANHRPRSTSVAEHQRVRHSRDQQPVSRPRPPQGSRSSSNGGF
jgi:hypothetical protein